MSQYIKFDYAKDNYYEELKETDVLNSRLNAAQLLTPYIGKYYSHSWIRSNIFKQSDEDRQEMDAQIQQELSNQIYYPPPPPEPQQ
jgi:hypothetical protein